MIDVGYQEFCERFEEVCREYGRVEANRMFEDDPTSGIFHVESDDNSYEE